MCRTVSIGILVGVEIGETVDNRLRLLRRRGIVEPDQRRAIDPLVENRDIATHSIDINGWPEGGPTSNKERMSSTPACQGRHNEITGNSLFAVRKRARMAPLRRI